MASHYMRERRSYSLAFKGFPFLSFFSVSISVSFSFLSFFVSRKERLSAIACVTGIFNYITMSLSNAGVCREGEVRLNAINIVVFSLS